MNIIDVKQERFDEVVAKFQKYGIGIVMTNYVNAENQTAWHELVYPNRVTGRQIFTISRIKARYLNLFEKASKVAGLAGALGDEELGPDVAFTILDDFYKSIPITWEELTLFAYAAYTKRKKSDAFANQLAKAKIAKDNMNKNLTIEQRRVRDQKILDDFNAEYGSDLLSEDED